MRPGFILLLFILSPIPADAQTNPDFVGSNGAIVNCNMIYSLEPGSINAHHPKTKNTVEAILPNTGNLAGLAVGPDFTGKTNDRFFYSVIYDVLHYYDGTKWVSLGHKAGAVNIAAGNHYIFSVNLSGQVYRYDGTGDATVVVDIDNCCRDVVDLLVDTSDNFYVISLETGYMLMYDKDGNLLKKIVVIPMEVPVDNWISPGLAQIGDTYHIEAYSGQLKNDTLRFTDRNRLPTSSWDYATCAGEPLPVPPVEPPVTTGIDCDLLYGVTSGEVLGYNPATGKYIHQIAPVPFDFDGLAICKDLSKKTDNYYFYTSDQDLLYYYDGNQWVYTGHHMGYNVSGGTNYLFDISVSSGNISRYDGTGDAKVIVTVDSCCGQVADLVVDKEDNFYVIPEPGTAMLMYSKEGALIRSFVVEGLDPGYVSAGFAAIGTTFYVDEYQATLSGDTLRFSDVGLFEEAEFSHDYAACAIDTLPKKPLADRLSENVYAENNVPLTISGRDVELLHEISVSQSEFDIAIWDPGIIDGDKISLYLNGEWILTDYEVSEKKNVIHVSIPPGNSNNYLVMYAHNLGEYPPNTASLVLMVDQQEYNLVLTSDLESSGALNFVISAP